MARKLLDAVELSENRSKKSANRSDIDRSFDLSFKDVRNS